MEKLGPWEITLQLCDAAGTTPKPQESPPKSSPASPKGNPRLHLVLSAKDLVFDRKTKGKQDFLSSCKEHSGTNKWHKDAPNICIQLCQPLPATHTAQGLCR